MYGPPTVMPMRTVPTTSIGVPAMTGAWGFSIADGGADLQPGLAFFRRRHPASGVPQGTALANSMRERSAARRRGSREYSARCCRGDAFPAAGAHSARTCPWSANEQPGRRPTGSGQGACQRARPPRSRARSPRTGTRPKVTLCRARATLEGVPGPTRDAGCGAASRSSGSCAAAAHCGLMPMPAIDRSCAPHPTGPGDARPRVSRHGFPRERD